MEKGQFGRDNERHVQDIPSPAEKVHGSALKRAVKNRWQIMKEFPGAKDGNFFPLFNTFAERIDELDEKIWEEPREGGAINSFYAAVCTAFQYAHLRTDGQVIRPSQLSTPEECWSTIQATLNDPQKRDIFYENMWKPPITMSPQRKFPVQLILHHQFGDAAISGVDIGSATGTTMPLLNTYRYTDSDFPGKEDLMERFDNQIGVNIASGLNVDINTQAENVLFAKANAWWSPHYDEIDAMMKDFEPEMPKFPFLTLDITDKQALLKMRQELHGKGRQSEVQFVLSMLVRHQTSHDQATQKAFKDTVNGMLEEGGIWIDIGEELMNPDTISHGGVYKINVYQKTKNELVKKPHSPFHMDDHGNIKDTDMEYFIAA